MKAIPDEKVDLVVTDPPFAINFKAKRQTTIELLQGFCPAIMKSKWKITMILQMLGCMKCIEF